MRKRKIGIEEECFDFIFTNQIDTYLCWAACIEMALKTHCVLFQQKDILEKLFKGIQSPLCYPNCPENFVKIQKVLNGLVLPDTSNKSKNLISRLYTGTDLLYIEKCVITELSHQRPIILGCNITGSAVGHGVTIVSAICEVNFNNDLTLNQIIVLDPADRNSPINLDFKTVQSNIIGLLTIEAKQHLVSKNKNYFLNKEFY